MNAPDANGWLPIESAPKDGTKVDLWICPSDAFEVGNERRLPDAKYVNDSWCFYVFIAGWRSIEDEWYATHWQPLPKPPVQSEASQ